MVSPIYPWQEAPYRNLWQRHLVQKLPHALLLSGPEGIGKQALAQRFAQALLCTEVDEVGAPCGLCQSCHLFDAQNPS